MEVHPPNSLLPVISDTTTSAHDDDSNTSVFPKIALAETLRLLEVCGEKNVQETDFCLAAASAVLQAMKDSEDGGKVLETLQSCTLDALERVSLDAHKADTRLKSGPVAHSTSQSKPEEESAFWRSCREVAVASGDGELAQFTAALETFSQRALHLVTSYLTNASRVLPDTEVMQFLSQLCKQWWSPRAASLLEKGGLVQLHNRSTPSKQEVATSFSKCVKNLAAVHMVLSMQARISHCLDLKTAECARPRPLTHGCFPRASDLLFPPSAPSGAQSGRPYQSAGPSVVRGWLCSDALSPVLENLANTTPMVVYRQYQHWLETEQCVNSNEGSTSACPSTCTVGLELQRRKVFGVSCRLAGCVHACVCVSCITVAIQLLGN